MRRDEVVLQLRQLERLRCQLAAMERALDTLEEQERDILEAMYVRPKMGNADLLCEKWEIERSTVYRRRDKALKRLTNLLQTCATQPG